MAFSIPCDACRTSLSGRVFAVRASTFAVISGAPVAHRLVPSERPSDYLFCTDCANVLDSYVRQVAASRGLPQAEAS
jgi:hypothetical protein